jgi:uncharacterized membrane protein
MEPTWRLYAAIFLGIIALIIVVIFIFLLLHPKRNKFDTNSYKKPQAKKPKLPSKKTKK